MLGESEVIASESVKLAEAQDKTDDFDSGNDNADSSDSEGFPEVHVSSTGKNTKLNYLADPELSDGDGETSVKNDNNSDSESEEEIGRKPKAKKMSRILDDDDLYDDEEDSDNDRDKIAKQLASDNESSKTEGDNSKPKKSVNSTALNMDLFDDEQDDASNDEGHHSTKSDNDDDSDNKDDDEDPEISDALRRKLKKMKGASKTASKSKKDKKQKEILDLHSETQRIVRESRVNLPYHQPKPLSLQDILDRRKTKQLDSISLRAPIHKVLAHKGVAPSPYVSRKTKEKQARKEKDILPSKDTQENNTSESSPTEAEHPENNVINKDSQTTVKTNNYEDDDYLPDLAIPWNDNNTEKTQLINLVVQRPEDKCQRWVENISPDKNKDSDKENLDPSIINEEHTEAMEQDSGVIISAENSNNSAENSNNSTEIGSGVAPKSKRDSELDANESNNALILDHDQEKEAISKDKESENRPITKSRLVDLVLPELKNFTPKLCSGTDTVIDLDSDDGAAVHPGVNKLLNRLLKHQKKKSPRKAKEIEMSVVCKEKDEDEREQLKLKKFTVKLDDEEEIDPSQQKPGAKLSKLKSVLQAKMKQRREQARQKRVEAYDLDNEEGFEGEDEDEAELTDQTDTDEEEEEEVDEDEDVDADDEEASDKDENPFIEEECEESSVGEEDSEDLDLRLQLDTCQESEEKKESGHKFLQLAKEKTKNLDLFDDETKTSPEQFTSDTNKTKVSERPFKSLSQKLSKHNEDEQLKDNDSPLKEACKGASDADSSFELIGTMIPAYQPHGGMKNAKKVERDAPDLFSQFAKPKAPQITSKLSEFSLPIEDSQDLLNSPSQFKNTFSAHQSDAFHLSFDADDTQSQLLDADGYLKVDSAKKSSRRQLNLNMDHNDSQNNFDELLDLCSGQFSGGTQANTCAAGLFKSQDDGTQDNMNELLGLCSGTFTVKTQLPATNKAIEVEPADTSSPIPLKRKKHTVMSEDEDSKNSFDVLSDEEDQNSENETDHLQSEDDEKKDHSEEDVRDLGFRHNKFKGFTYGKNKMRKEFVDEEAELSGSEVDSDENLDLDEKDDVLELEDGDFDDVGTEEKLRTEVERVHIKQILDEDQREIRLMQERYLPDGDLYSDKQRTRKYRWAGIDDDMSEDMFKNQSDEEIVEENEEDTEWRLKRLEREKWLQEQKREETAEQNNQILKLGSKVFKLKPPSQTIPNKNKQKQTQPEMPKPALSLSQSRRGSFLSRPKEALEKIAEGAKGLSNVLAPKNSRNFVFAAASPEGKTDEKPKVKRSQSVNDRAKLPNAKKPRLERSNTFNDHSIFNLM